MTEIKVRPMTVKDAAVCATIHTSSFKGFFLTFLGPGFVKELYADIVIDPTGISIIAERDGQPVGFVVGSIDAPVLYRNLIRYHLGRFAVSAIGGVLRQPKIVPRLLRALRKPAEKLPVPNSALLMSIAVLPGMQGLGIGQKLIQSFLEEARRLGREYVVLETDAVDNDSANRFYHNMGFSLLRSVTTPEGRVLNEYVCALPGAKRDLLPQRMPVTGQ